MLRRKKGALWLGVGLSAFYWVADSVIDAVFYHEGTITSLVFSPSVHEISTRLMALILITSVVYTSVLVYKYKKAVKTLEKTTQTLQSIFQASPVAIIVLNPEQKVIMWSPAAERIFGWSEREVIGKFNPIVPEDKKDEFKSFCERIMRGEFFSGVEIKRQRKNKTIIDVSLSTAPVYDDRGNVTGILGILSDITDRKRIEEELKKSEGKLKAIIETEPECVKLVAADGTLMEMNPAGLCMIEADSIEQVRGKSVYGIMDPEFCEQFKQLIEDVFKGDSRSLEFKITGLKGTQRWLDTHAVPFRSAEGEIIAVLAITRDTTERKKMEEQIFQIQHDWEDTFNIITDMITVHDKDFNIIHANKAAEKILGLPILPGKKAKCYKYYHGTECPPEGCPSCQTLKTGKSAISEIFEPHLNKFIEIRAIPRFDSNNNLIGLIHVVRDITERRKLENQLRQSQKMEAIGQLAGGIAHDFNNIITAIIGYASIMKMKVGPDDPLRISIDQVLSSSEKATNLVQSLLAFSRKQISNPEPVKINRIIKSIEKLLSRVIGEDIELKIELTEDLTAIADIVQIEQVLLNLCTNARDAMPEGGTLTIKTEPAELTSDFTIAHGYGEEGRYIQISVSDTGAGMDEKTKDRIFEPFFTTKEFGKGTGLGLAIVYGIIKQHKGYITCQSEPGKGTTFNIYLPVIKAVTKEIQQIKPPELAGTTGTILFAEDEDELRKLTRQMLEDAGYNVIEAIDGTDAVNKFIANKDIDLLLFDVIMPKMGGKEAYDKIKKIQPDIKVLFISGYPADFIGKYGVLEQGLNFISKPVSPTMLLKRIIAVLGNGA